MGRRKVLYPPPTFIIEAYQLGVSKRIANIPKGLELGKTWVLLAHKKTILKVIDNQYKKVKGDLQQKDMIKEYPAIFYAFRPKRIEKLITQSQATDNELAKLKERGITPVIVPENDLDHQPKLFEVRQD